MNNQLVKIEEAIGLINEGKFLLLAGEEKLLTKLPVGNWIGGTIPYFITEDGGQMSQDKIFITQLPDFCKNVKIATYTKDELKNVYNNSNTNEFSVIIIPGMSNIHSEFALNAQTYDNFGSSPLVGWVSGVHLNELPIKSPKVFNGKDLSINSDSAVVMHVELPTNKYAELNIVNIFSQGNKDKIQFLNDGFSASEVLINGNKQNLVDYIESMNLNVRFPLVANYSGAMINTSFNSVDKDNKNVSFYAPVFKDIEYRQAENLGDYVSEFMKKLPADNPDSVAFSCNCILNYLYCELEGKKTGDFYGPITFGEIAYMLLNQTFVYLSIKQY